MGNIQNRPRLTPAEILDSETYRNDRALSARAGVDLQDHLDETRVAGYDPDRRIMYMLFFSTASAPGCERDFLIQRVKLTKSRLHRDSDMTDVRVEHLIEVLRLNPDRETMVSTRHQHNYGLGNVYMRTVKAEYEIGCGSLPGIAEGRPWPFSPDERFRLVEGDPLKSPHYGSVRYDFSTTFGLEMEFNGDGLFRVDWPDFMQ